MKQKARKKMTAFLAVAAMVLAAFGCGGQKADEEIQNGKESAFKEALEVLQTVKEAYKEDDVFSMYGGDQANAVMDAPGKFDISQTEELSSVLGLPESQFETVEDAASMVHMMNANTFTGAVYRLKDDADMEEFADAVKENILARQWMCGQPDTLAVIDVDGMYVITAFGEAGIMETFQANALSALDGAKLITEAPIG